MIAFKKVKDAYGWLSNMSPHPIEVGGITYRTAEHLFQAMRFPLESDARTAIVAAKSPMAAKMEAKKYAAKMVIAPRGHADQNNMAYVLLLKVAQHPDLAKALIETHKEPIVEDVTARPNESGLFWGMAKDKNDVWTGSNILGRLWMAVREELLIRKTLLESFSS